MTLILENGSGVIGANSYIEASFVTTYLTDRGRQTENSWGSASTAIQENHVINATDYIEQRFRQKFKGQKLYMDLQKARAVLKFTRQPSDGETVVLGTDTFTFKSSPVASTDVAIDTKLSVSINNLIEAVNTVSLDITTESFFGQQMLAISLTTGEDSNSLVATTTVTGATWNFATLNGGNDVSLGQPLSFPRSGLFDRDGIVLLGVPINLKSAVSEYAVRSLGATLLPDPIVEDSGRLVLSKTEKVGPIEESVSYDAGSGFSNLLQAYPAADQLLKDFFLSSGGVFR